MGKAGIDVLEIHSRKSQAQRTKTSDQFRSAKNAILFSSVRVCLSCQVDGGGGRGSERVVWVDSDHTVTN